MITLQFFGATRSVTGSCFLVQHGATRLLVDCGLIQGPAEHTARNRAPFAFDPASLDAVILTHAHLDHTGLVPRLMRFGFRGRIVTTTITKEFLPILWADFLRVQEGGRPGEPDEAVPLYEEADVQAALLRCDGYPYGREISLTPGARLRFADAGHILGSAIVELWLNDGGLSRKLVFSGDLGHTGKPIVRDPQIIDRADALVLESTYGDRNHRSMPDTVRELGQALAETLDAGGVALMPVYAIGRSQDVLYVINQLTLDGVLDRPRVFLDSPMAIRAAEVYARHVEAFDEEAQGLIRHPPKNRRAPHVQFTETIAASRVLARMTRAIILAGSGMCEGGRIQEHLARHLGNPAAAVIFTGFQVDGTLGRRLVDGAPQVRVLGTIVPVRAKIHTINGLSAHADRDGLLGWLAGFRDPKPATFLVHGEPKKMEVLASAIEQRFGLKVTMPAWGDRVTV
ncbi:MBL fold metallo-hydrolase RNA specificity domain-containing protein [Candidatus Nitrospira bockiana]